MKGNERVVVTGHRGYLGTVLTGVLAARGCHAHGVDARLVPAGLLRAPVDPEIDTVADIRDLDAELLAGADAVIHLAGLSNDPLGELDPDLTDEINHEAAVRLARLAREQGVRRFVFASSCSLYGASDGTLLDERSPLAPVSAYARAKAAAERSILALATPGFTPVALRLATLHGPSPALRTDLVANRLVVLGVHHGCVSLESDGRSWRPLLDVRDAAEAMASALEVDPRPLAGRAFNVVGPSGNLRMEDLARLVGSTVPDSLTVLDPDRPPDPRSYRVSARRLRRAIGHPRRPIVDGLHGVLDLLAEARPTLDDLLGPEHVRLLGLRSRLAQGLVDGDLRAVPVRA